MKKMPKLIFCFGLILALSDVSRTSGSVPIVDVFWLDRYGSISWENERARLDNFSIHLIQNPDFVGYVFVNAGRCACRGEAQARAIRAKNYMMKVRGVEWNRVAWRDLGYREEPEVVLYLFKRNAPIPFNPEYEPAKEGQIIENCSMNARRQRKRCNRHPLFARGVSAASLIR